MWENLGSEIDDLFGGLSVPTRSFGFDRIITPHRDNRENSRAWYHRNIQSARASARLRYQENIEERRAKKRAAYARRKANGQKAACGPGQ